ncbi:hypothetical protein ACIQAL_21815 [Pseudomonas sp. NPDC088368]|uniref:hypothetical protein n=1 Tax=Pseudomonas sp. NPDC088368 TaxID=3364453 RepID=UPI0038112053
MSMLSKKSKLEAWYLILYDDLYRADRPEDYHKALIRRADELVLQNIISLEEWQVLKNAADDALCCEIEKSALSKETHFSDLSLKLNNDLAEHWGVS